MRETLHLDFIFPGIVLVSGHGVRGPHQVLLPVPPRHEARRGHGTQDDVSRRHLLQPERFPLQPRHAQRPVPRGRAARAAKRQVR